jgi:hypothetical protein
MEKMSLFGERRSDKENLLKKTGKGIITVSTIIGAGILVGMGFKAFQGASEGN